MEQPQPPPLPPIPPSEALERVRRLIADILLKNTTLINYYIYPSSVPTEIAAYEPRLKVLESRVSSLSKINIPTAAAMIDNFLLALAQQIFPILPQLFHACLSFQQIFIDHYDPRLKDSMPYESIIETIRYCHGGTEHYIEANKRVGRPPVEAQIPIPPGNQPGLCPGAIGFMNHRDRGKISMVAPTDYLPRHHDRIADNAGVILWWSCNFCAFRLRYHASMSSNSSINSTNEIICEKDTEDVAYRCAWLVKSHIYHPPRLTPTSPKPDKKKKKKKKSPSPEPPPPPRAVSPPPSSVKPRTTRKGRLCRMGTGEIYIVRKSTSYHSSASKPSPKDKPDPAKEPSKPKPKDKEKADPDVDKKKPPAPPPPPVPDPVGPRGLRYFCPFCTAYGLPLTGGPKPPKPKSKDSDSDSESSSDDDDDDDGVIPGPVTCFRTSAEFVEHVDDKHNTKAADRPVGLLLSAFRVALQGNLAPELMRAGVRWDMDLS